MEVRIVQKMGKSTLVVVIPHNVVKALNIEKGTHLLIRRVGEGFLAETIHDPKAPKGVANVNFND